MRDAPGTCHSRRFQVAPWSVDHCTNTLWPPTMMWSDSGSGCCSDEQAQPLGALPVSGRPYLPADSAGREPGAVGEHAGEAVVALPGRGAGPVGRQGRIVRPAPTPAVVVGYQGDALAECVVLGKRRALHDDEQPAVRQPAGKRPPGVESLALVENNMLHGGRPVCRQRAVRATPRGPGRALKGGDTMAEHIRFEEGLIGDGFSYAFGISTVDLTGNGFPDIVAMDTDVGLYWFENDGSGRFTRHVIHERAGEWLERHEIADIDGDGRPEIVSVDNKGGSLLWFEFDGDPRERRSWTHHYITDGGFPGAYDLAVADLDGDGDLDVAATNWRIGNEVAWFENRQGRYVGDDAVWVKHTIEEGIGEPRTILAVDFDRDGRMDLLGSAVAGNQVIWYENPGDPARKPWTKHVIDSSPQPTHGSPGGHERRRSPGCRHGPRHATAGGRGGGAAPGRLVREPRRCAAGALAQARHRRVLPQRVRGGRGGSRRRWPGRGGGHRMAGNRPRGLFKHGGDPRGPWSMQVLKEGWTNADQVILVDLDRDGRLDIIAAAERGSNELRWWRNLGPA